MPMFINPVRPTRDHLRHADGRGLVDRPSVSSHNQATVHNLRAERMGPGDIRIDRKTELGNEFIIGRDGSRVDVIAKFEAAERTRLAGPDGEARRAKGKRMHGRRLFCWCAPQACHGDVYARLAAELVSTGEQAAASIDVPVRDSEAGPAESDTLADLLLKSTRWSPYFTWPSREAPPFMAGRDSARNAGGP